MAIPKPRYSTADIVLASHLAGAGKSAAEITAALHFPNPRSTYDLLSRYGISLVPRSAGQVCVRLAVNEKAVNAGLAVAAAEERDPARSMALALEELLLSPNTFKELLAAAERRRK